MRYDAEVPEDRAALVSTQAGTDVALGTTVAYYLSRGPRPPPTQAVSCSVPRSSSATTAASTSSTRASRSGRRAGTRRRRTGTTPERRKLARRGPGPRGGCRGRAGHQGQADADRSRRAVHLTEHAADRRLRRVGLAHTRPACTEPAGCSATLRTVDTWRCPHCGTTQADGPRCWACSRHPVACGQLPQLPSGGRRALRLLRARPGARDPTG